jgi:hypothetical protein
MPTFFIYYITYYSEWWYTDGTEYQSSTKPKLRIPTRIGYEFSGYIYKENTFIYSIDYYLGGTGKYYYQIDTDIPDITISINYKADNTIDEDNFTFDYDSGGYNEYAYYILEEIWVKKTYKIVYNLNGYIEGLVAPTPTYVEYNASFLVPTLSRINYSLTWCTNNNGTGDKYTPNSQQQLTTDSSLRITESNRRQLLIYYQITLYADWKLTTFTLSYNYNTDSVNNTIRINIPNVEGTYSTYITSPENYSKDNINYLAISPAWFDVHIVYINPSNTTIILKSFEYRSGGNVYTLPSIQDLPGYTFVGYDIYAKNSAKINNIDYSTNWYYVGFFYANASLNIIYNLYKIVLKFSSTTGSISLTYTGSFTPPQLNIVGYITYWNTKADNTGDKYAANVSSIWRSTVTNNSATLYAQAEQITYRINYFSSEDPPIYINKFKQNTYNNSLFFDSYSTFTDTEKSQLKITLGQVFAKWKVIYTTDTNVPLNKQYNDGGQITNIIQTSNVIHVQPIGGYTISYNLNGASGTAPSTSNVPNRESYNGFPSITSSKTGYRANGWNTSSSAQTGLTSITVDSNKTLYAVWASNIFKIIYYANNGTTGSTSWTCNNIGYPNTVNFRNNDNPLSGGTGFAAPINSGKTFIRWSTNPIERQGTRFNLPSSFAGWTNSSNLNVYAKWGYTVQYQQNPNMPYNTATGILPPSSNEESGTIIGNGGLLYAPTNTLSLTGYKINKENNTSGWNSNKDATSSLSTISSLNENLTLYPIWKADSYTINYNANNGTETTYSDMVLFGNNIVIKSANQVSITPPAGRVFVRWSTESQERQGTQYNVGYSESWTTPSTRTLFAKWGYKVIYNSNNGDGNLPIYDVEEPSCNIRISLSTSGIKKLGYTIATGSGWNTSSSGNTSITDITIPVSTDITLYIAWNPNIYTINFDQNFGTNTTISRSVTYPSALTFLGSTDSIKRTGYTLKSWNSRRDGTGITSNLNKIINSGSGIGQWNLNDNSTVYAQWEDNYDGKFLEVIVNKGGSGYTSSTTLNINNAGPGRGAHFTPIITDGIIRSVIINSAGSNYSLSSSITVIDSGTPAGSGAELIPYIGKNTTLQMVDIKTRLPTIEVTTSTTLNKYYNTVNTATSNIINNASVALISPTINQSGQITSITINHPGAGYISPPIISFANQGSGTNAQFNITIGSGQISYIYIIDGGNGYTSTPTLTATDGGATIQASFTVTITSGKITNVTINNRGTAYTSSPTITVTGGGSPSRAAEIIAFINGITNITVTNSGTNYAATTKLEVSQPPINMTTFKGY